MNRLQVFSLFLIAAIMSGCTEGPLALRWDGDKTTSDSEKVLTNSYKSQALSILQNRCVRCHVSAASTGKVFGFTNLSHAIATGLIVPGSPEKSRIYSEIASQSMPPKSPLSADEQAVIYHWIANNSAPTPSTVPGPTTTTMPAPPIPSAITLNYENIRKYVLAPSCIRCHSEAGGNRGDVNLETYQSNMENLKDIKDDVLDGSMPKKGKLTEDQKNLILAWINAGAPENSTLPLPPANSNGSGNAGSGTPVSTAPGNQPIPNPELPTMPTDPVLLKGWTVFNTSGCNHCHTGDATKPLAGGKPLKTAFGTFYPPNITPSVKYGIGKWTAEQFKKALRKGISPEGEFYYPAFPYTNYSLMTDADILSLYKYLKSLKPIEQKNTPNDLPNLYQFRPSLAVWRSLYFKNWKIPGNELDFRFAEGPFAPLPSRTAAWNRGAYLVESQLHCAQCHTPRDRFGGPIGNQWMAGSVLFDGMPPADNLTPDRQTGHGNWRDQDWQAFLKTGKNPDGESVSGEMRKIIRAGTSQLNSQDLEAVIIYLQDLPAVNRSMTSAH